MGWVKASMETGCGGWGWRRLQAGGVIAGCADGAMMSGGALAVGGGRADVPATP